MGMSFFTKIMVWGTAYQNYYNLGKAITFLVGEKLCVHLSVLQTLKFIVFQVSKANNNYLTKWNINIILYKPFAYFGYW